MENAIEFLEKDYIEKQKDVKGATIIAYWDVKNSAGTSYCGCPIGGQLTLTRTEGGNTWIYLNGEKPPSRAENPYIPIAVYCDTNNKTTVVKWNDGEETKVTCDIVDTYSPEAGFYAALAIKVFGNDKRNFKDFWYPVISRRIFLDGKKAKPVAYGKWKKQREDGNAKRKNHFRSIPIDDGVRRKVKGKK